MKQTRTHIVVDFVTTTHVIADVFKIQVDDGTAEQVTISKLYSSCEFFTLDTINELRILHKGIGEVLEKLDE